jgi:hypothetical protein
MVNTNASVVDDDLFLSLGKGFEKKNLNGFNNTKLIMKWVSKRSKQCKA